MNINNFGDRLSYMLKYYGISSLEFAKKLELAPPSVSRYITGKSTPNLSVLEKILIEYSEINPSWLILGVGNMIKAYYNVDFHSVGDKNISNAIKYFIRIIEKHLEKVKTDDFSEVKSFVHEEFAFFREFLPEGHDMKIDEFEKDESFEYDTIIIYYDYGIEGSYSGIATIELT